MSVKTNVTEIYGSNVFNDSAMRERLPKKVYDELKRTIENGEILNGEIAESVAIAMKDWAIEKGATHYTHWFQPLTGITAEKHDSFISPLGNGRVIMEFKGKELIKGEPDASSFPSGGLRATFEARGYTAWDCTSPAFLKEDAGGITLCIPTVFCSYTGEALDKKTPVLRSMEAINKQALRILRLFGDTETTKVTTYVGAEQEYFLVDANDYKKREDLIFTGRTLFGAAPPKGQELDDQYFGTLKDRVAAFMHELNIELWKLGISAKTQHNEAAPAQHELAPIFDNTNIATDHNQLIMEEMKKIAAHHGFACLLHEKPFAGVNGSGKHNNWSLSTNTGRNLLDPGKKPNENKEFLLFLVAVIEAVDRHADLLRLSAANPGNDHRLGANEAPPAIISIYLGDQLEQIVDELEKGETIKTHESGNMAIGVSTLPVLKKDTSDRNRTSPFAFTGNKFEFRMVPSSASIGAPNFVLNTAVAEVLEEYATKLEKAENFEEELDKLLTKAVKEHKRIIFNGNGYSDDWVKEAEKRGLPNITNMVDATEAYLKDENIALFEKFGVLTRDECEARAEVKYEKYGKVINIEAKTMLDMAKKQIKPAVMKYAGKIAASVKTLKEIGLDASVQQELLIEMLDNLKVMDKKINELEEAVVKAKDFDDIVESAKYYNRVVFKLMGELREPADKLELLVDKEMWPFPTYADILFYV